MSSDLNRRCRDRYKVYSHIRRRIGNGGGDDIGCLRPWPKLRNPRHPDGGFEEENNLRYTAEQVERDLRSSPQECHCD